MPAKSKRPAKRKTAPPSPPVAPVAEPEPAPAAPPVEEPKDMEEAVLETAEKESGLDKKNRFLYAGSVAAALAIIAVTVGIGFVAYGQPTTKPEAPVPAAVESPTPTPAPTRTDITIEVLNGSGISGAAGKAAENLREAGYTTVIVGNTTKQKATELFLSRGLSMGASDLLLGDTLSLFSVSSSSGDLTNGTTSARLILGSE